MKKTLLAAFAISALALGCQSASDTAEGTTGEQTPTTTTTTGDSGATTVAFADVEAILQKNCVKCHQGEKAPEELQMTSYAELMEGGEHGPVIVAGKPDESLLLDALHGRDGAPKMPPAGNPAPTEEEIAKIEAWIKDGAKE